MSIGNFYSSQARDKDFDAILRKLEKDKRAPELTSHIKDLLRIVHAEGFVSGMNHASTYPHLSKPAGAAAAR